MHDNRYIPIFVISIRLNLYRYCITGLVYHDMAIYQYIVTSLLYTINDESLAGLKFSKEINLVEKSLVNFFQNCKYVKIYNKKIDLMIMFGKIAQFAKNFIKV